MSLEKSASMFYKPPGAWLADVMPFYAEGAFHLFHLHDLRELPEQVPGGHWGPVSLHLVTTTDFVHFENHGEVLHNGGESDQDLYVFTGSFIRADDRYLFFYCGFNPHFVDQNRPAQAVMRAQSRDLVHWKRLDTPPMGPTSDRYEMHDWRDPYVFWNEDAGEYWMILTARLKEGPPPRRGCLLRFTSPDLETWTDRGIFWSPGQYLNLECPEVFRIGDWWYLVYSTYSERWVTHYRMARSLDGPWQAPRNDTFDSRSFYAAKTSTDGHRRYVIGWIPTRRDESDLGVWEWGGSLLAHEVVQNADGTLGVRPPAAVRARADQRRSFSPKPWGRGASRSGDAGVSFEGVDGFSHALGDELPLQCRIEATLSFAEGTRGLGLILRASDDLEAGYYVRLEPHMQRLVLDILPRRGDYPFAPELERPVDLVPGRLHRLSVLVDGSIAVVYLDDTVAMTFRMYREGAGRLGVFCQEGAAEFADVEVWTERL